MVVRAPLTVVARPLVAAIAPKAINPAMSAYSMRSWPDSSFTRLDKICVKPFNVVLLRSAQIYRCKVKYLCVPIDNTVMMFLIMRDVNIPFLLVPNLIHRGPGYNGAGGQVCTGTYETGTKVILKENFSLGSTSFGGCSSGDGAPG